MVGSVEFLLNLNLVLIEDSKSSSSVRVKIDCTSSSDFLKFRLSKSPMSTNTPWTANLNLESGMPPGSTPQTSTTRGSSPISSFASRRAASTLVSPGSSRPPGKQTSPLWDLSPQISNLRVVTICRFKNGDRNRNLFQSKCPPCEEQGRFTIFDAERNHYSRVDLKLLHSFRHTYTCKNLHCFVFHSFVKHAFDARCHWMRCSRTEWLLNIFSNLRTP